MLVGPARVTVDLAAGAPRRGFTLAEVTLALVLGALILGLVAAAGSRLEHQLAGEADRLTVREQLAAAAEVLPIDLRGLSPASGDIAAGGARDSSVELRGIIGNALVCGGSSTSLILAPYLGPGARSIAPVAQDGDTAWLLTDGDSAESWRPVRLRAMRRITGNCSFVSDASGAAVFDVGHLWAADLRDSVAAVAGAIVRLTRPMRLSFYRASDGRWYLGLRSWSSAGLQFNSIQPISGPYAPVSGDGGTRLQYFDSAGNRIASGSADTRAIARVEAVLLGESSPRQPALPRESVVVVAALRNRR